jgi:hypothetical protein
MEKIGSVAYRLDLSAHSQVHPVFHVSQLNPFTPDHRLVFLELPAAPSLDVAELVPKYILDRWLTKRGNTDVTQVLVKWSSLVKELATKEDYYVLRGRFPSAPAWGQVEFQGGVVSRLTQSSPWAE